MAKKKRKKRKKKLSPQKRKKLRRKNKIRKLLTRTVILFLGVAAGILARPSIISDPVQRAKVEQTRDQVLNANDIAQEKAYEVLGDSTQVVKQVINTVSETTKEITHTDPQVIIQEKVETFTEEIKTLPEKQIKKIKLEFCRDIIEEIELTCETE